MRTRARLATGLVLAIVAALVLALALMLLALNRGVTLGFAQTSIERILSKRLGRDLALQGAPYVQLGQELRLSVSGLQIANAQWGLAPDFLTLESVDLRIDTRSLFSRPLVINRLEVAGAKLSLEIREDGTRNTPVLSPGETDRSRDAVEPDSGPALILEDILLRDIAVRRSNRQTGSAANLSLTQLAQSTTDTGMSITGDGFLQDHPWSLQLSGSPVRALLLENDITWDLRGQVADLDVQSEIHLPARDRLADMRLTATASGSLPEEITSLSPLLDPGSAILMTANISDVDPGITVDIDLDLPQLRFKVAGVVDQPGAGDGFSLALSADAQSIVRLATALGLGATDDVPLSVHAQVTRRAAAIQLTDLVVHAGEHEITGEGSFPAFPSANAARLTLAAKGPDFAFYQRLLQRPVGLPYPYSLSATLRDGTPGIELLSTLLHIGELRGEITGSLGNFPSYRGSALKLSLTGPSLASLGDSLNIKLPPQAFTVNGLVSVSEESRISLSDVRASSLGTTVLVEGSVNGWPELDELRADIRLSADSLAQSSAYFGVRQLGDVPATLRVAAGGSLREPVLSDLELKAGELTASTRGAVYLGKAPARSDLKVQLSAADLPSLLGDFSHDRLPSGRFDFTLAPTLDAGMLDLRMRDFTGPGMTGNADLMLASSLRIDERTRLDMALDFRSLAEFLPAFGGFTPADRPLSITVKSQSEGATKTLKATASSADTELLTARIDVPDKTGGVLGIHLEGEGQDLQALGRLSFTPDTALPYRVVVDAQVQDSVWDITTDALSLAGTDAIASLSWDNPQRILRGTIDIPRGNIAPWLTSNADESQGVVAKKNRSARRIPKLPIPTDWLHEFTSDLLLTTGPLGIEDPAFQSRSLIDSLQASLTSGKGQGVLEIRRMTGSRGVLSGTLNMQQNTDRPDGFFDATLSIDEFPLGITSHARFFADLPRHTVRSSFRASGTNLRDIAATLDGELLMVGGSGTLENTALSFATESFLSQLFSTLLPGFEKSSDMQVACSVIAARAEDGILALDPGFVLRTENVDLTARGTIDLRDESLAIRFDNQARKGLGISAGSLVNPYVQITGTLQKPSLGLDMTSTAISGGAAIATGGLTVLARPLYGRFLQRRNPCETALKHWQDG